MEVRKLANRGRRGGMGGGGSTMVRRSSSKNSGSIIDIPVPGVSAGSMEVEEEVDNVDAEVPEEVILPPRRRGRPPKNSKDDGKNNGKPPAQIKIRCLSVPVTEEDDQVVECKMCGVEMVFRKFRVHNMQSHCNIAQTKDDSTVPDHKFYDRRLKELAKFAKVKTFRCPVSQCSAEYKSALGLAYHLETCGKTPEEIDRCLIACEICGKKFTLPNLAWHKKTHNKNPSGADGQERTALLQRPRGPRKSAIRARETLQKCIGDTDKEDSSENKKRGKGSKKEPDDDYAPEGEDASAFELEFISTSKPRSKRRNDDEQEESSAKNDFCSNASNFLSSKSNSLASSFWNRIPRVTSDPFDNIPHNSVNVLQGDVIPQYLISKESVAFKTIHVNAKSFSSESDVKGFRRLPQFEGEVIDSLEGNLIYNVGCPIIDLDWHPSGRILAVSTHQDLKSDIDYKVKVKRKSSIHIYVHQFQRAADILINWLVPQCIFCVEYGYATHIRWCNLTPKCWDSFCMEEVGFKWPNRHDTIGYLACSFEDGTIRIFKITIEDMNRVPFQEGSTNSIPAVVCKKVSEICLKLDDTTYPHAGQACTFDWHEETRFLVAGYCGGVVAVFDVHSSSPLLTEVDQEDGQDVKFITPFWSFHAHLSPITGIHFDPMAPRYFVTASKDRYLKLWDVQTRQEIESRKVGLVRNICWIRGWIHLACSTDAAISNLSSQYNFVRFYQLGSGQAKPNCAEFGNVTSISFHEGLTVQATEFGTITSSYFDNFWRDYDYERNKKKYNMVNICKTTLDVSNCQEFSKEDFKGKEEEVKKTFTDDEPNVVITIARERMKSYMPDPAPQHFEDFVRFLPFVRINKVIWSPLGNCFVVGYRNGLLMVVPADFKSLYES